MWLHEGSDLQNCQFQEKMYLCLICCLICSTYMPGTCKLCISVWWMKEWTLGLHFFLLNEAGAKWNRTKRYALYSFKNPYHLSILFFFLILWYSFIYITRSRRHLSLSALQCMRNSHRGYNEGVTKTESSHIWGMPGNNHISNAGIKKGPFNKNILKSRGKETRRKPVPTASDGTEFKEETISTRSWAGQWCQMPRKIEEEENQKVSIGFGNYEVIFNKPVGENT